MTETFAPADDIPVVPPNGWQIEDFPQITVMPIPYATNPRLRADPAMSISPEGWLYTDLGMVRIAFPNRDEFDKYVEMAERMFNSHEIAQQAQDLAKMTAAEAPPE